MKLTNIRLETVSDTIYAQLRDDDGNLVIGATLHYILTSAAERGYKIEGVAEKPVFDRYRSKAS